MEIRQLRYFVVVAELENFNRAAERLHVAQPALSRQVKALEEEVGIELFERLPRGVRLTAAGHAFADRARRILMEVRAAHTFARGAGMGELGSLRLGINPIAGKNLQVLKALRQYRNERSAVQVTVSTIGSPEQVQRLDGNELDVGFLSIDPTGHPDLECVPIARYTPLLAMLRRHPLARSKVIKMSDLRDEDFIWTVRQRAPWVHDQLIAACLDKGFSPKITQEVDNADALMILVSVGLGIAFVHPLQRPLERNIVFGKIADIPVVWPLYMCSRREERAPVVNAFLELARQTLKLPATRGRSASKTA